MMPTDPIRLAQERAAQGAGVAAGPVSTGESSGSEVGQSD
jgi:hypothetical protein